MIPKSADSYSRLFIKNIEVIPLDAFFDVWSCITLHCDRETYEKIENSYIELRKPKDIDMNEGDDGT